MSDPGPPPVALGQVFPPTLREVMLRGRWIAMLGLCLLVAGVFAWLGQWQLARAIDTDPLPPGITEEMLPIDEVLAPGVYLAEPLVGQRVSVAGSWVPGDFIVVSSRFNDGVEGFWVTGQLRVVDTETPTSLAVAIGFAQTREQADAAASALSESTADDPTAVIELEGRLVSDEGPGVPSKGADPFELNHMSPAALLGRWHDVAQLDVYRPYLVASGPGAVADLDTIVAAAPDEGSNVNWLNIFYAVEWAVFAGFAFYFWYRLARDAWEREVEELEELAAETGPTARD